VLARSAAVFSEPAGAVAYAGLVKAVKQGLVKSDETIVCMTTRNSLKDVKSAMKVAGVGTVIEPTLEAVRKTMRSWAWRRHPNFSSRILGKTLISRVG
jgi:threonine synthase